MNTTKRTEKIARMGSQLQSVEGRIREIKMIRHMKGKKSIETRLFNRLVAVRSSLQANIARA